MILAAVVMVGCGCERQRLSICRCEIAREIGSVLSTRVRHEQPGDATTLANDGSDRKRTWGFQTFDRYAVVVVGVTANSQS